jgi:hypothetical protein
MFVLSAASNSAATTEGGDNLVYYFAVRAVAKSYDDWFSGLHPE